MNPVLVALIAAFVIGYFTWATVVMWRRQRTLYVDRYRTVPPDVRGLVDRLRDQTDSDR